MEHGNWRSRNRSESMKWRCLVIMFEVANLLLWPVLRRFPFLLPYAAVSSERWTYQAGQSYRACTKTERGRLKERERARERERETEREVSATVTSWSNKERDKETVRENPPCSFWEVLVVRSNERLWCKPPELTTYKWSSSMLIWKCLSKQKLSTLLDIVITKLISMKTCLICSVFWWESLIWIREGMNK